MKKTVLTILLAALSQLMFAQVRITPVDESYNFPKASLEVDKLELKHDSLMVTYEVENFNLGNQTPDAPQRRCANSEKGQHIHFILDNQPYTALYKPQHIVKISDGEHILLSFLSRSYHESIKEKRAMVVSKLIVANGSVKTKPFTQPMLFYSRPKANYIGADTARVLLDFYLCNVTLSENGYKVKATINGQQFTITKWQPYLIEGLPMGSNSISIELQNEKGETVNKVERKITLAASEPIQTR